MEVVEVAGIAGFFAAHAVWCVSDGETLIPMLVVPDASGKPAMTRLASQDTVAAVADAKARLANQAKEKGAAVLLYDTLVTLGTWRTDAVMIEAVSSSDKFVMLVPYRTAQTAEGFAVYKPKFTECPEGLLQPLVEAFFRGVAAHEKGNAVWSKCLDQSK